jgi:cysteinyl-tRNA synthetase
MRSRAMKKPKPKLKSKPKPEQKLKLYDTLTRKEQPFRPLDPANVRMYVCGPTVYDFAHIGNARPVIVFDVLFRLLRHLYGADHVTYVRNITDVDDKINARAAEEYPNLPLNQAIRIVTEMTERQFHEDVEALGCLRPTFEPRATEQIDEMKELIRLLIERKRAYVLNDHILFRVKGLKSYGQLSRQSLEDMRSSARGEVAPKRDLMDFVLWKPSKPGEPAWPSPGGIKALGRPGWHIECSAMSWKLLGKRFDIHGGGIDLLFPHHENERAQSYLAFRRKMARFWMHNGFLRVEGDKMSKSLGNFVTIRELLRGWQGHAWSGAAIRLAMLNTHYTLPLDWTRQRLAEARDEMSRFAHACRFSFADNYKSVWDAEPKPTADVVEALSNDLNTSDALSILRDRHKRLTANSEVGRLEFLANLRFLGVLTDRKKVFAYEAGQVFVGDQETPLELAGRAAALVFNLNTSVANSDVQIQKTISAELSGLGFETRQSETGHFSAEYVGQKSRTVDDLISERNSARKARDFERADRIREELRAKGIELEDQKDGTTTWKVVQK